MSRTRPAVISLSDLEQAAKNASAVALNERQLVETSGGAIAKVDPTIGTTMGMFPVEPTSTMFSL